MLINSLILAYGLPILWLFCVILVLWEPVRSTVINYIYGFMLLLLFTLVSLNVRLYFHPSDLTTGKVPLEEIYAYSVAWIVLAISLLIAGTLYKSRNIRFASFVMMLLSILKVFLFDASELDGILRVLAFLGLGLSLIGLSWFYTRFILRTENDPTSVKS